MFNRRAFLLSVAGSGLTLVASNDDTADIIKAVGGETDPNVFVLGIRAWY